jgi:hypothetical protein
LFVNSKKGIKSKIYLIIFAFAGTCVLLSLLLKSYGIENSSLFTNTIIGEIEAYLR